MNERGKTANRLKRSKRERERDIQTDGQRITERDRLRKRDRKRRKKVNERKS